MAAADRTAKAIGADPKVLMKKAATKAKVAGFCTGAVCRAEEIKAWAHNLGQSLSGSLGIYAKALAHAVSKVTHERM